MPNKNAHLSALLLLTLAIPAFAGRFDESPNPVQVLTSEEIREMRGIDSIEDLVGRAPNVVIDDQAPDPAANVTLRGLGADRGLVLLNGTRPRSPGMSTPITDPLDPDLVDRVEVLRGPQGTLFGRNTTGGAVNIVTSDRYQGIDPKGSWTLQDIRNGLRNEWFSVESKEQCDATRAFDAPNWYFSDYFGTGLPKVFNGGDLFVWGDDDDDDEPRTDWLPPTIFGQPDSYADIFDAFRFQKLDELIERIRNSDTPEQDKRDRIAFLSFSAAFGGPGTYSDTAAGFGVFDPDAEFEEYLEWSSGRTDAERAEFDALYRSAFGGTEMPESRPATDPAPAEPPAEPPPPAQDEATPQPPRPDVRDPWDVSAYPPDYAFDFSVCTDEQRQKIETLIRERDQARADHSYYTDYLRARWRSSADIKQDKDAAAAAIRTREEKNEELRRTWLECVNPPSATTAAAAPTEPVPPADGGAEKIGLDLGYKLRDWDLEFHIQADYADEEPVPGIGVDTYRYRYGMRFGLPWGKNSYRDIELDAGAGSRRTFTDERGVARIDGAFSGRGFFAPSVGPGPAGGMDPGAPASPARPDPSSDWRIFADFDFRNLRNGPTLGLRYKYSPRDSVYQEFLPPAGVDSLTPYLQGEYLKIEGDPAAEPGAKNDALAPYIQFGQYFDGDFSIGGKTYATYTYPQFGSFDSGLLDRLPGQTYWANNECGDSALPPEGGGYLTAAQSPVKSVADQWALERVGLAGDEPALDEFAKPVVVGIIDTGIDWNHLDLAWENLWRNEDEIPDNGIDDDNNGYVDDVIGWNFTGNDNRPWDNDGHGTFVAGVIAATQGNDAGIDGINGHARIMVLKALNNFGRTRASWVAQAIVYGADNGAQILNLSVTGPGFPKIVQDAVDYAESKGVLVVVAAGNRAENVDEMQPPPLGRALVVAATGPDDRRAAFSNTGIRIDLAAPGVDVVSLRARATDFMHNSAATTYQRGDAFLGDDGRYYRSTGTSFAAPIVSGVASLVLANNPGLTPAELRRVLVQSARDAEIPGRDRFTGYGIVDAKAALAADPAFFIDALIPGVEVAEIDGETYIRVIGTAMADEFASATVEIGPGEDPQNWTPVGSPLDSAVEFGQLALIPPAQLSGNPSWTARLVVKHANGRAREARFLLDVE